MTGRPRGFRVASMRHRIDVSAEVTEQDATGQPVVSLATWLTNEPAAYEDVSGGETTRGRQVEAGVNVIFTVRYRDGYARDQVVIHDGTRYGIVHVGRVDGIDRYRELHCKAVV